MSSESKDQQQLIFLWIVPRTCSTVLSKCMTFVDDVQVWMEPYLGCLVNETLYNPSFEPENVGFNLFREKLREVEATDAMKSLRKEIKKIIDQSPGIIDQKEISRIWVKEQLEKTDQGKNIVFVKDQATAVVNHLEFLPERSSRHTFLIRHPREVMASVRNLVRDRVNLTNKQCEQYTLADLSAIQKPQDFFPSLYKVWKHARETSGEEPVIIDAYDLLTKPEVILPKYFQKVGIPFKERYLEWEGGANIIGKWNGSGDFALLEANTVIYERAAKSSKFDHPQRERGVPSDVEWKLSPELLECVEAALPYYEEMYEHRLR